MSIPELHSGALREPIPPELLGHAALDREGAFAHLPGAGQNNTSFWMTRL